MTQATLAARPQPAATRRRARLVLALTLAVGVGLPTGLFGGIVILSPLWKALTGLWQVAALVGLTLVLLTFGAVISGMSVWWEMRVSARMQSRVGYNRVGAGGFLQWIADAVKLLFKEDLVPADADGVLFRAAPYFVFVGFGLTFVALPFGESLIAADLDVGLFYLLSVTALVVVGILVAGWSSNSKWSLFGGMRSAAQVISYEIPAGLAAMVPVLMAGTLSMQGIIRAQGAWPWEWNALTNPFALVAFFVFFIAQLAEGNRTPFDLPEAESELVAGYLSEYSSFRFAIYFLVEWGNLWVMSAVAVTLFLGGWQVPGVGADVYAAAKGAGAFPALGWWGLQVLSMIVFVVKTLLLVNLIIWIRWTLPRIRVDQMMSLCWKYLVPFAFVCFVGTLFWQILVTSAPWAARVSGVALTAAGVLLGFLFLRLTLRNVSAVGDRVDLGNW
jgi:NADH-quinone oxidoreductase subunit H